MRKLLVPWFRKKFTVVSDFLFFKINRLFVVLFGIKCILKNEKPYKSVKKCLRKCVTKEQTNNERTPLVRHTHNV